MQAKRRSLNDKKNPCFERRAVNDTPTPYTPTLYFGKGLGDLPYTLSWITPIAITGQIGYAIPARNFTATFGRGSFVVLRNPA